MADEPQDTPNPIDDAGAPDPGGLADDTNLDTPGVEERGVDEAMASVGAAAEDVEVAASELTGFEAQSFDAMAELADEPAGINLLSDVDLNVRIELGRTRMYVEDVLRLNPDSVIELDKAAGDPVDIFVNERLVARRVRSSSSTRTFCVRVSEIIHQPSAEELDPNPARTRGPAGGSGGSTSHGWPNMSGRLGSPPGIPRAIGARARGDRGPGLRPGVELTVRDGCRGGTASANRSRSASSLPRRSEPADAHHLSPRPSPR